MICLMPNCGFLSETSRMLEIHRALLARGADVVVLTHGGPYVDVLRDHGVDVTVLGPGWDGERVARFMAAIPDMRPGEASMWSVDEIRDYVALEADFFGERGVTAAVTGWTLTALLSTQVAGIPLVTEHAGAFLPPMLERGRLVPPERRLGIPLEGLLPGRVRRWVFNRAIPHERRLTAGLNRVADELGVPGVPSLPAMLMGDLTLVTDVPEVFGVPRADVDGWVPRPASAYRPGARLRYTGPLFAHLDVPVPERVERFLGEDAGPVVYVAPTSTAPDRIRALVGRVRVAGARVLVAATVNDLSDLEDERVMVEQVLPSHLVMPRVDAAVIAGGQGSVQTAMASGTPFVGFALQPEQATNLSLAVRQGCACEVPLSMLDSESLTDAVRGVLADPQARAAAARVRDLYATTDGAGAAAAGVLAGARRGGWGARPQSQPTRSFRSA
jgi:UDP:flavonoid glycosyltransferase YjiC (YdhE family)